MSISPKYFWRLLALITILLIGSGTIWGRGIPGLRLIVQSLPLVLVTLGLIVCLSFAFMVQHAGGVAMFFQRETIVRILLLVLSCATFIALSEYLIVADIERIHFIKFSLLAFSLCFSEMLSSKLRNRIVSLILASSLGIGEECLQILDASRVFDLRDICINVLASSYGGFLALIIQDSSLVKQS